MKIHCIAVDNGIELSVNERKYNVEFPSEIWKDFPAGLKKSYVASYAFLKSLHLPQMLNENTIEFNTMYPMFKNSIQHCLLNSVAFTSDVDGASSGERIRNFINLQMSFGGFETSYPSYENGLDERAVLSISFGKDSLLTYALAEELNLEPELFMSLDNDLPVENRYKTGIVRRFEAMTAKKVYTVINNTSVIHRYKYWNSPKTEWGFGHLITEYCLNALPFMHSLRARYLLIGNEKSCDDSYVNSDGYLSYPVYDQSSEWLLELTRMTKAFTNNQAQVMSLIEPLHDLAVMRILHKRYPKIGEHQMSCFPDENEYGQENYWCCHCSKCARSYILLLANNIDPKSVGFKTNMLKRSFKNLFSVYSVKADGGSAVGYDACGCGRDEQLFAFYLACRNGAKGELIDDFRGSLFDEASEREDEFHKKYYGIHDSRTLPRRFLRPLHAIFREELG
ncbi:MAG: hypothetical protein ABH879_01790 [archaeon]